MVLSVRLDKVRVGYGVGMIWAYLARVKFCRSVRLLEG